MSTEIEDLLDAQRADGEILTMMLAASDEALASGDRAAADEYGWVAEALLDRIRARSRAARPTLPASPSTASTSQRAPSVDSERRQVVLVQSDRFGFRW